jgi:FAD:protein FMN transferase
MGCAWTVTYVPSAAAQPLALAHGIQATLERVVAQMSTWEADSDITRFNRAARGFWLPLPAELARVLACALRVAEASAGALDPTAGELVTLWGFGAVGRHQQPGFSPPDAQTIETALGRCGWQRIEVDTRTMLLYQPGGLQLDLSALAKGFGVDAVCEHLREQGVEHHLLDVGGELRGAGVKPDGQPWWVEVQLPPGVTDAVATRIALHGLSVATSGDHVQGFQAAGRHYSHCIDPRTGRPVESGVAQVTVLHEQCMEADAWSTALMVLGAQQGMALAEQHGLAAQWWVRTGESTAERCSSAFRALIASERS